MRAALEKAIQPTFHLDPVTGQRSMSRLKALAAERQAEIYLCHDAAMPGAPTGERPTATSSDVGPPVQVRLVGGGRCGWRAQPRT